MRILSRRVLSRVKRAKNIIAIICFVLLAAGSIPLFMYLKTPKKALAGWMDPTWSYRKPITIINNGSSQTNYVIEVVIDTQSLQSGSKLQNDCDDVRFTSGDGATTITYFQDYCSTTTGVNGTFFVKVPTIAASGNTTIYFYYGNNSVAAGQTAFDSVGYPSSVVLGTGKDGSYSLAASANITQTNKGGRSCADGGDGVTYNSTATTANGTKNITVTSAPSSGCLAAGDELMILNAQGNNTTTGNGTYEFVRFSSNTSNVLTLTHNLTYTYNGTDSKVVVVRVPNYTDVTTGANTFNATAWNGTKGGVMAFRASGTVNITASGSINVNGGGYRGGAAGTAAGGGGSTGESYDGASSGRGGDECNPNGNCDDGASRGGGRSGNGANTTVSGSVTGGGGGGGGDALLNSDPTERGGGGGGGGGGYAGGGGGGGGNADANSQTTGTGGSGGSGGADGTAAGGGGGSCYDATGTGSDGNNGGSAGSAGIGTNCTNGNGSGGAAGSTTTQGEGGGGRGANATGNISSGAGGGGGGYYGVGNLSQIFFGSGGGGGGGADNGTDGTAGGAGGGIVYISSSNITVSGNITTTGGSAAAGTAANGAGTGGGGAGGSIYIKTINDNLGSSLVTANAGTGGGAGNLVADGGDGGSGRIHIDQTDTTNATTSPTANITRVPYPSLGTELTYTDYAAAILSGAYLPFNEGTGTTVYDVENSSAYKLNGTLAGGVLPAWQIADQCIDGGCLYFDGGSSKVSFSQSIDFKSVDFWIRPVNVVNAGIFDFGNDVRITTDGSGNVTATGVTSPQYYINGVLTKTPQLVVGQWQHLAVTTSSNISGTSMYLGNYSTQYFRGYIDELRLTNTQLDEKTIGAHMRARGGSKDSFSAQFTKSDTFTYLTDSLIGYWNMEANGATASAGIDYSGGNSGFKFASGSAYLTGKYGYGAEFQEGKTRYMLASSNRLDNAKTFAFWVKPESATNYFMSINEASIQSSAGVVTTTGLGTPQIYVNGQPTTNITTGAWQQVVVTTNASVNSTTGDPIPDVLNQDGDSGFYQAIYCVTGDDCKLAWYNANDTSLRFMDCDDPTCTSGSVNILDGGAGCVIHGVEGCDDNKDRGQYLAMFCVSTSDCKIVYEADGNKVRMVDCNDPACSTGSIDTVDGVGCSLTSCNTTSSTNFDKSIYCPTTSDCKIDWYNNDALRFADCDDATCSSGTVRFLDGASSGNALSNATTGSVGYNNDIFCPTATDCKLSYDGPGAMFADCSDATCSTGQVYTLDAGAGCVLSGGDGCGTGRSLQNIPTSIYCPSASDCKISYGADTSILMADCDTANCTSGSIEYVDGNATSCGLTNCSGNATGIATSISCTATDNCKIGYYDRSVTTNDKPMLAACTTATCSSGVVRILDGNSTGCVLKGGDGCTNVMSNTTDTIDVSCPSGSTCKVSYYNGYNTALILGSCGDDTCSAGSAEHIEGFKLNEGYFASTECPTAGDCKMAYLNDRASLIFMDCDDASCTSGTTRILDGDTGCRLTSGDGCSSSRIIDGYIDMDCPSADDCKIVYYDATNRDMLFADCADATCSTGSVEQLDGSTGCSLTGGEGCSTTGDEGFYPTIDCPTASNCKISYFNDTNNSTMFGDCDDATCSTGSTETMDGSGCGLTNCSTTADIRIGFVFCPASNDCKVSVYDNTNGDLRFADCDTETCATGTVQIVDGGTGALTGGNATGTTGDWNSLYCPSATNCKIAYRSSSDTKLNFADCDDATCDTGTISSLDGVAGCVLSGGDGCTASSGHTSGFYPSIVCPTSTNCKIAYQDKTDFTLHFADCDNETCSSGSTELLDGLTGCALSGGDGCSGLISTGEYTTMACPALDPADCKIVYQDSLNGAVQFGDCANETCSSGNMYYTDIGYDTTLMLGRVGLSNYMDGQMDEVRLYNRQLSTSEVSKLYEYTPGPVGYWKFDDNTGTTVIDSSGNGNTGNITNFKAWVPGKFGSAVEFLHDTVNGRATRVDVGSGAALDNLSNTGMTLEAWGYLRSNAANNPRLFSKEPASGTAGRWQVFIGSNNSLQFQKNCTPTADLSVTSNASSLALNQWQHMAVTWTGNSSNTTVTMYINGQRVNTTSGTPTDCNTTPVDDSSLNLTIGDTSSNTVRRGWDGIIDDARVYNYVRTASQIIEDMNGGHPVPGSPVGSYVGYWKFDELQGTTAYDSGPNRINLTVEDASDWSTDGKFGGSFLAGRGTREAQADNITQNEFLDFAAGDSFTVSAWAKSGLEANPASSEVVVAKYNATAGEGGYELYYNTSGQACFGIVDTTGAFPDSSACSTIDSYDRSWHHLLGVRNVSTDILSIFVDGKLVGTAKDATTTSLDNGDPFRVGQATGANDGDEFQGLIDEVKMYRTALNESQAALEANRASQIQLGSLGTQPDGSTAASGSASIEFCVPGDSNKCLSPIGYWKFDDGSGTSVTDYSGLGSNGTWNGAGVNRWVKGKFGFAGNFDWSKADFVNTTNASSIKGSSQFTAGLWFFPIPGATAADLYSESKNTSNISLRTELTVFASGNQTVTLWTSDDKGQLAAEKVTSRNKVAMNKWNYVEAVYDSPNSTAKIFLNGFTTSNTAATLGTFNTTDPNRPPRIGMYTDNFGSNPYHGYIDQVVLYNYARTPAQVSWDYNRGAPQNWWKFDECSGSVAYDNAATASGAAAGWNATINAAAGSQNKTGTCSGNSTEMWYGGATGKFNSSLNFDGDDYVSVSDPGPNTALDLTTDFTVSAWANRTSNTSTAWIVSKMNITGSDGGYAMLAAASGTVYCKTSNGTSAIDATTNSGMLTSSTGWTHLVIAKSGSKCLIYINGVDQTSLRVNDQSNVAVNNDALTIGSSATLGEYFVGKIDDVRLYNYQLTPYQVKLLYNEGFGVRFGPASGSP